MPSIEWRGENTCRIIVSKPKPAGQGYEKVLKTINFPAAMSKAKKQKEADKAAFLFEEEVKQGNYLDGEKLTLAEFVDIWMREYAVKELAPSTLIHHKMRLQKRVLPALGHMKLAKIQPHHITAFYNNLKEAGIRMDVLYQASDAFIKLIEGQSQSLLGEKIGVKRDVFARLKTGKCASHETVKKICTYFNIKAEDYFIKQNPDKTLSASTVKHHHSLLSGIFSFAMQWNLINDNPVKRVKLPSITKAKSPKPRNYDDEQVIELLAALEGEPIRYYTIIYVALDTGLRLSEIAGLKWCAINFETQTIDLATQRLYVPGYGVIEDSPKTESGIRLVTLSDVATKKLLNYKQYQDNMRAKLGDAWHGSDIVFTHDDGKPLFPTRPSTWFKAFLERKGLSHLNFHGLRHTNASLMIGSDTDIVTVSGRLGHADKNVTLNYYAHMIRSREKQVANKMDQFYGTANDVHQGVMTSNKPH